MVVFTDRNSLSLWGIGDVDYWQGTRWQDVFDDNPDNFLYGTGKVYIAVAHEKTMQGKKKIILIW